MILYIYLCSITSIALSCRCIPVNITLICLAPYRNLYFAYPRWCCNPRQEYIKCSCSVIQILYLYLLYGHIRHIKRGISHKYTVTIPVYSIQMHLIYPFALMAANRYICFPCAFSCFCCLVPDQIILPAGLTPDCKINSLYSTCQSNVFRCYAAGFFIG